MHCALLQHIQLCTIRSWWWWSLFLSWGTHINVSTHNDRLPSSRGCSMCHPTDRMIGSSGVGIGRQSPSMDWLIGKCHGWSQWINLVSYIVKIFLQALYFISERLHTSIPISIEWKNDLHKRKSGCECDELTAEFLVKDLVILSSTAAWSIILEQFLTATLRVSTLFFGMSCLLHSCFVLHHRGSCHVLIWAWLMTQKDWKYITVVLGRRSFSSLSFPTFWHAAVLLEPGMSLGCGFCLCFCVERALFNCGSVYSAKCIDSFHVRHGLLNVLLSL